MQTLHASHSLSMVLTVEAWEASEPKFPPLDNLTLPAWLLHTANAES